MGGESSKTASPPPPAIPPPPSPCLRQPWRNTSGSPEENLNFVKNYQPQNKEVKHLRILLHGPVGAGKSSFFNSVESALRGRVTTRALTDAITGSSFTLQYKTYKIRKDEKSFYPIVFNDIMGFEPKTNSGVLVDDVKMALRGHVKDGYEFSRDRPLTEENLDYNKSPSLDDQAHALVCVVPASGVNLLDEKVMQKLREVRRTASDLGIPQLAILTKVDEACPEVKENINNVYKSKYLKEKVEKFSMLLGIPVNCIFLVKNYESEINTCDSVNGPILTALKQMISYGEDYLSYM